MKEFASLTIVAMKIGKTVFHLSQQWLLREENSSSETWILKIQTITENNWISWLNKY